MPEGKSELHHLNTINVWAKFNDISSFCLNTKKSRPQSHSSSPVWDYESPKSCRSVSKSRWVIYMCLWDGVCCEGRFYVQRLPLGPHYSALSSVGCCKWTAGSRKPAQLHVCWCGVNTQARCLLCIVRACLLAQWGLESRTAPSCK